MLLFLLIASTTAIMIDRSDDDNDDKDNDDNDNDDNDNDDNDDDGHHGGNDDGDGNDDYCSKDPSEVNLGYKLSAYGRSSNPPPLSPSPHRWRWR